MRWSPPVEAAAGGLRCPRPGRATIITSNRDVDEWYPLFGAQPLAGAALDRLLHHAHVVVMDGDTHRSPTAAKRARRGGGRAPG